MSVLNLVIADAYRKKGGVTITNAGGGYWDISFHAEGLLPGIPLLRQIATGLAVLAMDGVFRLDLGICLVQVLLPDWEWDSVSNTVLYVEYLLSVGVIFAEAEVAADFPCHERPVRVLKKDTAHKFRSSRYSNDGKKTFRLVEVEGQWRKHSKGSRKDFVIEYDRGRKTGSPDPLWRIELRLQRHHLDRLSLYDLTVDFHTWVIVRTPWLAKFLRRAVEPGGWSLRKSELTSDHWLFWEILQSAGWAFH